VTIVTFSKKVKTEEKINLRLRGTFVTIVTFEKIMKKKINRKNFKNFKRFKNYKIPKKNRNENITELEKKFKSLKDRYKTIIN